MQDVHFRIDPKLLKLIEESSSLIHTTRSGVLRSAVAHAIIGDATIQEVYDNLVAVSDLISTFEAQGNNFVQDALDGNSENLENYLLKLDTTMATLPPFWRTCVTNVLRDIPEFRVVNQVI